MLSNLVTHPRTTSQATTSIQETGIGSRISDLTIPSQRDIAASQTIIRETPQELAQEYNSLSRLARRMLATPKENMRIREIENLFERFDSKALGEICLAFSSEQALAETKSLLLKSVHRILDNDKNLEATLKPHLLASNSEVTKGLAMIISSLDFTKLSHTTCQSLYGLGRSLQSEGPVREEDIALSPKFEDILTRSSKLGFEKYPHQEEAAYFRRMRSSGSDLGDDLTSGELKTMLRELTKATETASPEGVILLIAGLAKDCLAKATAGEFLSKFRREHGGEISDPLKLLQAFGESYPEHFPGVLCHLWGSLASKSFVQSQKGAIALKAFEVRSQGTLRNFIENKGVPETFKAEVVSEMVIGVKREESSPIPRLETEVLDLLKNEKGQGGMSLMMSLQSLAGAIIKRSATANPQLEERLLTHLVQNLESRDPSRLSHAVGILREVYGPPELGEGFDLSKTKIMSKQNFTSLLGRLEKVLDPQIKGGYLEGLTQVAMNGSVDLFVAFRSYLREIASTSRHPEEVRLGSIRGMVLMGDSEGFGQFLSSNPSFELKMTAIQKVLSESSESVFTKGRRELIQRVFACIETEPEMKQVIRKDFNFTNSPSIVGERLLWASNLSIGDFQKIKTEIGSSRISAMGLESAEDYAMSVLEFSRSPLDGPPTLRQLHNFIYLAHDIIDRAPQDDVTTDEAQLAFFNVDKLQTIYPLLAAAEKDPSPLLMLSLRGLLTKAEKLTESAKMTDFGKALLAGSRVEATLTSLRAYRIFPEFSPSPQKQRGGGE